jgi:hypothetical protein
MTIEPAADPKTPIGDILKAAGPEGLVLDFENQSRYALIPLDDDLIDFLIERNPNFRAVCKDVRARMDAGQFVTHEKVKRSLAEEQIDEAAGWPARLAARLRQLFEVSTAGQEPLSGRHQPGS